MNAKLGKNEIDEFRKISKNGEIRRIGTSAGKRLIESSCQSVFMGFSLGSMNKILFFFVKIVFSVFVVRWGLARSAVFQRRVVTRLLFEFQ